MNRYKALCSMPVDVRDRAVELLSMAFDNETTMVIKELFSEHGTNWIHKVDGGRGHFSFGMSVRNGLRREGLTDDLLPERNWDDYYVGCIELALGLITLDEVCRRE